MCSVYAVNFKCRFDGVIDELEMQVCHVIIYIQEGSHFGTGILRNFRVLQAAKHAMAPFVRYQTMGPLPSRSHPSPSSQPVSSVNNSSPGRGGGNLGRNMSAISLMSVCRIPVQMGRNLWMALRLTSLLV